MRIILPSLILGAALTVSGTLRAEPIKIAFIDPMSGPFAGMIQTIRRNLGESVDAIGKRDKWSADESIEVVPFDNKNSTQESLIQFKAATDQGYRYIMQGLSSAVAAATLDAVNKYNERNPGKEVVYLNYVATDPDLTNSKCSFWHFRFEPNVDMKSEAVTTWIAQQSKAKKIYLIGPNYSYGQQVSRDVREYLKRKAPSIEIVGDDLVPFGQVKDFSPYVSKIKSSGADLIVTANFGPDLVNFVKAARAASLNTELFAYTGGNSGVALALGPNSVDRVKTMVLWNSNNPQRAGHELLDAFKKKYPQDDMSTPNLYNVIAMLSAARRKAQSADPVKVAFAMEGMKVMGLGDEIEMRKTDHQLQEPLYLTTFAKVDGKEVRYDMDSSGFGWRTIGRYDSYVAAQPTSCQMKRPTLPKGAS